jgi:hypothetical protein
MKKIALLVSVLSCAAAFLQGQESPFQHRSDQTTTQNSSEPEYYHHLDFERFRVKDADVYVYPAERDQEYCAHIRAYIVRREHQGSDVVVPSGYVTCVPSKRFEFKSAVLGEAASSTE